MPNHTSLASLFTDIADAIRGKTGDSAALVADDFPTAIASIPAVRALLVEKQREYNTREAVVMEGRDIGTVVFPDTKYKYFVTASEEVRAARRAAEGITDSIAERDRKDSQRACAPLKKADDALLVDTSDMSIDQVVAFIAADIRAKLAC